VVGGLVCAACNCQSDEAGALHACDIDRNSVVKWRRGLVQGGDGESEDIAIEVLWAY
jgi:hypothetical protein